MNAKPYVGYWRITRMEEWDQDYVDLVVPGYIEFDYVEDRHIMGQFQFGTVSGGIHAHLRKIGEDTFLEWSWEGRNDNDPGSGRGWARMTGNELAGRIYIHAGDDSAFTAKRQEQPRPAHRGRSTQKPGRPTQS